MRKYLLAFILVTFTQTGVLANNQVVDQQWNLELSKTLEKNAFKTISNTTFSFLFWDLYQSRLLSTSGQFPLLTDDEKLLYEIEYFKAISAESLVEKTVEQWQHLGYVPSRYKPYLNKLKRIWPDIKSGDKLTFVMNNISTAFYHNKRLVGVIDDIEFGPLFLDIWLSEKTSEPELRQELLGRK